MKDPDQAHAEYYRNNPHGNHSNMAPETRAELNSLKNNLNEFKDSVLDILKRFEDKMDSFLNLLVEKEEKYDAKFVGKEIYAKDQDYLEKRLEEVEKLKKYAPLLNNLYKDANDIRSKALSWTGKAIIALFLIAFGNMGLKEFLSFILN